MMYGIEGQSLAYVRPNVFVYAFLFGYDPYSIDI